MIAAEENADDDYSSDDSSSVRAHCYTVLYNVLVTCGIQSFIALPLVTHNILAYLTSHPPLSHRTPQTESYDSEDELHLGLTDEQRLQKQLDAKNITVNLAVRGDGVNFPVSAPV